jgi:hypothetical protein
LAIVCICFIGAVVGCGHAKTKRPKARPRQTGDTNTLLNFNIRISGCLHISPTHIHTNRGTCPGVRLCVYYKSRYKTGGFRGILC